jgi:hypothetical protein
VTKDEFINENIPHKSSDHLFPCLREVKFTLDEQQHVSRKLNGGYVRLTNPNQARAKAM